MGLRQAAVHVQYVTTMEKVFTGDLDLLLQPDSTCVEEIVKGIPRTLVAGDRRGAACGCSWRSRSGCYTRGAGGPVRRPLPDRARAGRHLDAGVLGRRADELLPGLQGGDLPQRRLRADHRGRRWQWVYHLILPWTALSLLFIGVYSRVLRSNVLDTMNDDYVRTARAKGLSERQVLLRHVLRNSLIPIVTLWGLDFGAVLGGGAILTETVFDLQGVGQYAAESIGQLDVPPVLAVTMFGAFFIVLLNTIVDIVYAALDPRIRLHVSEPTAARGART